MKVMIIFEVPGKAVGKGRPRFSRRSGTCYTPAKTSEYEISVAAACREAMCPMPPATGPVIAKIEIFRRIPFSYSEKRKKELFSQPVTKKPDLDNVAKAILDACNGIAYVDDSQVSQLSVSKAYSFCDFVRVTFEFEDEQ